MDNKILSNFMYWLNGHAPKVRHKLRNRYGELRKTLSIELAIAQVQQDGQAWLEEHGR